MIPYGHQDVSDEDQEAVARVLSSSWLTQGPAVDEFEMAVANYCGVAHAVAVSSGTAALHLACRALDLGPGDLLWTSPNTFVASANCARYCGADVDFVDIDPKTYNIDPDAFAAKLRAAHASGRLPRVLVVVHFAGQSCVMAEIASLAREYGLHIIEDAAHALGGRYRDEMIGSCRNSDMTIFSFHPVKLITTGEGGMVLTGQEALNTRLTSLRSHGITRDPGQMARPDEGPWYYELTELGYNYRMNDIQAALGESQLRRIDAFLERRRELARRYDEALSDLPLECPWQHPDTDSAWHLYVIRLRLGTMQQSRRRIFDELRSAGIGVNVHYIPVHLQPYYQSLGFHAGDFPQAERYYREAITLPLYPAMSDAQQDYVINQLRTILS